MTYNCFDYFGKKMFKLDFGYFSQHYAINFMNIFVQ